MFRVSFLKIIIIPLQYVRNWTISGNLLSIVFFGNEPSSTVPSFLKPVDQFVHAFICRWNAMLTSLARTKRPVEPLKAAEVNGWMDLSDEYPPYRGASSSITVRMCPIRHACFFFAATYAWAKCLGDSGWMIGVDTRVWGLHTFFFPFLLSFFFSFFRR